MATASPSPYYVTPSPQPPSDLALFSEKTRTTPFWRRRRVVFIGVVSLIIVVLVVILPVYFEVIRPKHSSDSAASGGVRGSGGNGSGGNGGGPSSNPSSPSGAITGGDGSKIITENGTTFIYNNPFGGFWVQDPADPFNNNAQPNSWTSPLNTSWRWGVDTIYGVNLGGWLVTEPFITPALYQKYPGTARDEFTLSQAMRADTANGGIGQMEEHYKTFITEQDIAEIAGAGLNFLRIPIAFWAIETWEGEPYLERTSWTYFLKVLGWARKYGLRICLDLHAVPGSQNGYNHSGKLAGPNFLVGNMGIANAQRTLYYIRILVEFISQPEYRDLIPIFGIVNEPLVAAIGKDAITSFLLQAHTMIREITGFGQGNGPFIAIHNGFQPVSFWEDFLEGSDRIMMDQHPYFAFGGVNTDPITTDAEDGQPGGDWPSQACNTWMPATDRSRATFGVTIAGEFSSAPNDCGLFINGVPGGSSNPQCPEYVNYQNYDQAMKQGLRNFLAASADAFGDWFYWTWKIDPDIDGTIGAPTWSYKLGLENGWIEPDPRVYVGKCAELGIQRGNQFDGTYKPWQVGSETSTIAPESTVQFPWPPTAMNKIDVPVTLLPTYTSTGSVITLLRKPSRARRVVRRLVWMGGLILRIREVGLLQLLDVHILMSTLRPLTLCRLRLVLDLDIPTLDDASPMLVVTNDFWTRNLKLEDLHGYGYLCYFYYSHSYGQFS
ncbi:hypothetical protein D9758_003863 [Tetrapyrgos nigripes]|uniref:glucan 1,3-beta-glucosidase n=1 Tax=Tetrapyrgos nigripes TaxID=182062 RepID=A0A8H5GL37_9AGAR|nr:hypothetical protein D9758_003863 [Tetrapyrgos nigripes]